MEIKLKSLVKSNSCKNRCSDYTRDCDEVRDHAWCFLGLTVSTGRADGFCPFIHESN